MLFQFILSLVIYVFPNSFGYNSQSQCQKKIKIRTRKFREIKMVVDPYVTLVHIPEKLFMLQFLGLTFGLQLSPTFRYTLLCICELDFTNITLSRYCCYFSLRDDTVDLGESRSVNWKCVIHSVTQRPKNLKLSG